MFKLPAPRFVNSEFPYLLYNLFQTLELKHLTPQTTKRWKLLAVSFLIWVEYK